VSESRNIALLHCLFAHADVFAKIAPKIMKKMIDKEKA